MLARTPPRLSRPLAIVKLIFLLFTGGALLGGILGTLISLASPQNFISIVASSAVISGLGLALLGATDAENMIKVQQPDPEKERLKVQARLARLRNPSWRGMGRQVLGALACATAGAALVFAPGATLPHFLSAFILLRVPGRIVRSVGGKWERVIGETLSSVLVLGLAGTYSLNHPELELEPFLLFVACWALLDALSAYRAVKKDGQLLKTADYFEVN